MLCDSSGVKDIFIQDVLIVEGFAIPIDQVNSIDDCQSASSSTSCSDSTVKRRVSQRQLIELMRKMQMADAPKQSRQSNDSEHVSDTSKPKKWLTRKELIIKLASMKK